MKLLFALMLAIVVAACSSTGGKQAPAAATPETARKQEGGAIQFAESVFQESNGTVNLMFDAKGNWVRIKAVGTASLSDDSPATRETALLIASMRAKRTIAEFLNNDVKASRTLTRIARSYSRKFQTSETRGDEGASDAMDDEAMESASTAGQSDHVEKMRQANRVATILTERIRDGSSAIIKGAYVSYRGFDDGVVVVELTASRESIGAARQMSRLMNGVAQ